MLIYVTSKPKKKNPEQISPPPRVNLSPYQNKSQPPKIC